MKKIGFFLIAVSMLTVLFVVGPSVSALETTDATVVEIEGNTVYVYDGTLTVGELKTYLGSGITYQDAKGEAGTDDTVVYNGTVTAEGAEYLVKMKKVVAASDGAAKMKFWSGTIDLEGTSKNYYVTTETGIGGKADTDKSYRLYGKATGADWPWMMTGDGFGVGNEKRILTYEMKFFLPKEDGVKFRELYFTMKYEENSGVKEALFHIFRDGRVEGESGTLSLGQWHTLAITLNPYRGKALYYIDGTKLQKETAFSNYKTSTELRISMGFNAGDTGYLYLDDIQGYFGSYLSGVTSLNDGVVKMNGTDIKIYDASLTFDELTALIDARGAEIQLLNESGGAASGTDPAVGGTLVIDSVNYPIFSVQEQFMASDGSAVIDFWSNAFKLGEASGNYYVVTENGIGGKAANDPSYILYGDSPSASWPAMTAGRGYTNAANKIMTCETKLLIPDEKDNEFVDFYFLMNYKEKTGGTEAIREAALRVKRDGATEGMTLSSNQWHTLAVTLNPYRSRAYFYVDGIQVKTAEFTDYFEPVQTKISVGYAANKKGWLYLDDIKGYYGTYTPQRAETVTAQPPIITETGGTVTAKTVITPSAEHAGVLILARYNADDTLADVQTVNGRAGTQEIVTATMAAVDGSRYKAFIFQSLENLIPLFSAVNYPETR